MQEIDYMRIMTFVMIFLWIVYPLIVTKLRPKVFKGVNEGITPYANLFMLYCLIFGLTTTIGTVVILSLFNGKIVTFGGMIKGIIVGFICETIILFPDKLEKIFKINLKSTKPMKKFISIYLLSFIIIMTLIYQFFL